MATRLSGLASNMDTDSMVAEMMKAERLKETKIKNNITKLEWSQDKWSDLNKKLYSFYTGPLTKIGQQGSFNTKNASSSNTDKLDVTAGIDAPEGSHNIQIKSIASAQYVTGDKLNKDTHGKDIVAETKLIDLGESEIEGTKLTLENGGKTYNLEVTKDTTVNDLVYFLQKSGVNAAYDETQKRFFISSNNSGLNNTFYLTQSTSGTGFKLENIGLSEIKKKTNPDGSQGVGIGTKGTLIAPADAKIIYNGAEITGSSNTINVNGLTLKLKDVTKEGEIISTTVSRDNKAVYDMVKGYIKSYNEILKDMNDAYYASSARGYEPLTDEQKEAMTDEQIKQWEDKIKTSLMRRNNNLNSLIVSTRAAMSQSVEVDGKSYSLGSFGISAVEYSEKGIYHINGDPEDTLTAAEEEKLMKAITENPKAVMEVLNKIGKDLYSGMKEKMKSSNLNSALTLYNDKEMADTLKNYKKDLKTMEDKLNEKEDRYYKQFTAMEKALSKLNSQSSSLSQLLGTNSN